MEERGPICAILVSVEFVSENLPVEDASLVLKNHHGKKMYHDTLIRIKNSIMRGRQRVKAPYSRLDYEILEKLVEKGYLESIQRKGRGVGRIIDVKLKRTEGQPAISDVKFISKPSRKIYMGYREIKPPRQGYGHYILSTPEGIMDNEEAKKKKIGGQVLFEIW